MEPAVPMLRPPVKIQGGQFYSARWIVEHFPEHGVYCEPFGGGASVLLNKPRAAVEFYGELNPKLVNLFRVLQDPRLCGELVEVAGRFPYNLQMFELLQVLEPRVVLGGAPSVLGAALYMGLCRFSRNGAGERFSNSVRQRGGRPGDENSWVTVLELLSAIGGRLSGVNVCLEDALSLMARVQGPETLFYCDPPFLHDSRVSQDMYGEFEMSDVDHERLLNFLVSVRACGVFVSAYESDLYSRILGGAGWDCDRRSLPSHMAGGDTKGRKEALLWFRV